MPPKAKNSSIIILAGLMALQAILPALLFITIIRQKHVQEAFIKQNFKEEGLFETINLSVSDYKTLEFRNQHEISYKGNLYDIHSVKRNGNQISFMVISDKKEKLLEHNLELASKSSSKDKNSLFSAFFALNFISEINAYSFFQNYKAINHSTINCSSLVKSYLSVATPPPNFKAC